MAKQKKTQPSRTKDGLREYIIDDLRRVAKQFKDSADYANRDKEISREYYRAHGKFSENTYGSIFGDFATLRASALAKGWSFKKPKVIPKNVIVEEFKEILKKYLAENPNSNAKRMTKRYYEKNSSYRDFLSDYSKDFEDFRNQISDEIFGPTRDAIESVRSDIGKKGNRVYLFTAAMPQSEFFEPGWRSMQTCKKHRKAEIGIMMMRGIHSTHTHYSPELVALSDLWFTEFEVCENLNVRDIQLTPMKVEPLDSHAFHEAGERSLIIAHPKQHMKSVAVIDKLRPRSLYSTGVITKREYPRTGSGYRAQRESVLGGLIVEVEHTGRFWVRQFQFNADGSFADNGKRYHPDGRVTNESPIHLYAGDIHGGYTHGYARETTIRMIKSLGIKHMSAGDWFDGTSISHHTQHRIKARYQRPENMNTLEKELHTWAREILQWDKNLPKDVRIDIIRSNHDEHLDRYLDEERYTGQPENILMAAELQQQFLLDKNPLQYFAERHYPKLAGRLTWFERGQEERISLKRILISDHGDIGPNNSKNTNSNSRVSLFASNLGHSHSPSIFGEVWRAGTLATDMPYARKKTSSWQVTNIVTYADGMRQMYWVAPDGKHCLEA